MYTEDQFRRIFQSKQKQHLDSADRVFLSEYPCTCPADGIWAYLPRYGAGTRWSNAEVRTWRGGDGKDTLHAVTEW